MRYYLQIFILIICCRGTTTGQVQAFTFPNSFIKFIDSSNISWALETEETFSFKESNKIFNYNIYDYLITQVGNGKQLAKKANFHDSESFEKADTSKYNFSRISLPEFEIRFLLGNSSKAIKFHRVYYLDNYILKTRFMSAAPIGSFATASGISMGEREVFFCCKYDHNSVTQQKPFFLNRITREINIDSFPKQRLIKETYGFNLFQSLWFGASKGLLQIEDIKYNKVIQPHNVLDYVISDSDTSLEYDKKGKVVGFKEYRRDAVFPNYFSKTAEITESVYYSPTSNTFSSKIDSIIITARRWDNTKLRMIEEKRFKITFTPIPHSSER